MVGQVSGAGEPDGGGLGADGTVFGLGVPESGEALHAPIASANAAPARAVTRGVDLPPSPTKPTYSGSPAGAQGRAA